MTVEAVLGYLRAREDPEARTGMARVGIDTSRALGGTSVPALRSMARRIGKDHALALELWATGIHEARLLATMVDDPRAVTGAQMEAWVRGFDSWDLVDQCCGNLFDRTPHAHRKAVDWSARREEFVKRAGFALMACLAVHDVSAIDEDFEALLPIIEREAADRRNLVRKAVNWALRQIGKRNLRLNAAAIRCAERILEASSGQRNWVASNALRELQGEGVRERLRARPGR